MFNIDLMSRIPVYEQIIEQLENFVIKDLFPAGTQIPSVRNLSLTLSINPNTIQKAYTELDRKGIIYSVPGRGCFISDDAKEILCGIKRNQMDDLKKLLSELALAGIEKEDILSCIEDVYSSEKK